MPATKHVVVRDTATTDYDEVRHQLRNTAIDMVTVLAKQLVANIRAAYSKRGAAEKDLSFDEWLTSRQKLTNVLSSQESYYRRELQMLATVIDATSSPKGAHGSNTVGRLLSDHIAEPNVVCRLRKTLFFSTPTAL